MPRSWKLPRIRMRTLLILVALIGLGLGIAREYFSPNRVWRRAVRSSDKAKQAKAWEQAFFGLIDGLSPEQTVDEVLAATGDSDQMVRFRALQTYQQLDKKFYRQLPLFAKLVGDPSHYVRYLAAETIGHAVRASGSGREIAEPALVGALDDPDPTTREHALMALGEVIWIGDKEARDPLIAVVRRKLDDPDDDVWLRAAYVLARSGTGEDTAPRLMAYMIKERDRNGGKDPGGTGTADNILMRLANRVPEVVPFLLREAYRPKQGLSNRSLFTLQLITGPAKDRAFKLAEEALEGPDDDLRVGAALFLEMNGSKKVLRPTWLRILRHPDPDVRCYALNAYSNLDRFGRSTRDTIKAIRDNDPDPEVRRTAASQLFVPEGMPDPDASP